MQSEDKEDNMRQPGRDGVIEEIKHISADIYKRASEIVGDVQNTMSIKIEFEIDPDSVPTYKVTRTTIVKKNTETIIQFEKQVELIETPKEAR